MSSTIHCANDVVTSFRGVALSDGPPKTDKLNEQCGAENDS